MMTRAHVATNLLLIVAAMWLCAPRSCADPRLSDICRPWGVGVELTGDWKVIDHSGSILSIREHVSAVKNSIHVTESITFAMSLEVVPETFSPMYLAIQAEMAHGDSLKPDTLFADPLQFTSELRASVMRLVSTDTLTPGATRWTVYVLLIVEGGVACTISLQSESQALPLVEPEFFDILHSFTLEPYGWWVYNLQQKGLALTDSEYALLQTHPDSLQNRKREISQRYAEVLEAIRLRQDQLRKIAKLVNPDEEEWYLGNAQLFVETALRRVLFPLWLGGSWDLNGHASLPQSDPIACGWFLERLMSAVGFNVATAPGLHMAHLTCDDMIQSYAGQKLDNLGNWNGLEEFAPQNGFGIYLIGLDTQESWGHVLFLDVRETSPATLCHAGPSPFGSRVTYDQPKSYFTEFAPSKGLWAQQINSEMIRKWLSGEKLIPHKTKDY